MDHYRVQTMGRTIWAVVRYGDDGVKTVHMSSNRFEAQRMRDELERCEARAFKAGLIVGHSETLARPKSRAA